MVTNCLDCYLQCVTTWYRWPWGHLDVPFHLKMALFLVEENVCLQQHFILMDKCYKLVESEHLPLRKNESKNIIPLIWLNLEFHSESTWENSPVQVNCPILTSPQHIVRLWDEYTSCRKLPVTHTFSSFLQVLIRLWHEVRYVSLHVQKWLKRGSYRSKYHPCTLSQDKRLPGHLLDKGPWKFC